MEISYPVRVSWCPFCYQTPPEDLEPLHQLEAILPEYEHYVCSYEMLEDGGFKASIKMKIGDEPAVQRWLEAFQDSSKTTWRILKTYPTANDTVRNKYRVDFRCHQMRRKSSSKKNTSCPALLYLVLKRGTFSQNRKTRSHDPHMLNHLRFHIHIRNTHNHECSEELQHREVSQETVDKLIQLFQIGHTPTTALKVLKYSLQEELGESYALALADRAICPDLHFCFRLYYKTFKRRCRKKDLSAPQICMPPAHVFLDHSSSTVNQEEEEEEEECPDFSIDQGPSPTDERNELKIQLWSMFGELLEKVSLNEAFLEPVKAMVSSYEEMTTDDEIISALHRFGRTHPTTSAANQLKIRPRKYLSSHSYSSPLDTARRKEQLNLKSSPKSPE